MHGNPTHLRTARTPSLLAQLERRPRRGGYVVAAAALAFTATVAVALFRAPPAPLAAGSTQTHAAVAPRAAPPPAAAPTQVAPDVAERAEPPGTGAAAPPPVAVAAPRADAPRRTVAPRPPTRTARSAATRSHGKKDAPDPSLEPLPEFPIPAAPAAE